MKIGTHSSAAVLSQRAQMHALSNYTGMARTVQPINAQIRPGDNQSESRMLSVITLIIMTIVTKIFVTVIITAIETSSNYDGDGNESVTKQ